MKVSFSWLSSFLDLSGIAPADIARKLTFSGIELEGMEQTGGQAGGVVVAEVRAVEKHPQADKLSVCRVFDGREEVQVVCGAANVRAGGKYPFAPIGAVLLGGELKIKKAKLRGVESFGMLCSATELGLPAQEDGLMTLDPGTAVGRPMAELLGPPDTIFELEITPNRPDCLSMIGIARELAALYNRPLKKPEANITASGADVTREASVSVENQQDCPRYTARVLHNIKIGPSPAWMTERLEKAGIRSINNIVDITNYVMLETGHPMHAFDLTLLQGKKINVRRARAGEKIITLDGIERALEPAMLVIADDARPVALAGVMGGAETEVDENTKNIIVECATFDMYTIRRTSMRHGLFTDAVTRFNKGQSPLQNDKVLGIMAKELVGFGATVGQIADISDSVINKQFIIETEVDFINLRLGKDFSAEEVADLLARTEFDVAVDGKIIKVTAPFWRRDIKIAEDIVEEVGRLYGFDQLPVVLPSRISKPPVKNTQSELKRKIAKNLAASGANEVLTYTFVHGDLIKKAGQDSKDAYELRNAISPDLQYYRLSITPSILSNIHPNIKAGNKEFALFEIGSVHNRKFGMNDENIPVEKQALAFVYSANDKLSKTKDGAPYYTALKYLDALSKDIGLSYKLAPAHEKLVGLSEPYDEKRSALVLDPKGNQLGIVGEFKHPVSQGFKLPKYSSGFELIIDTINEQLEPKSYSALNRFPVTEQDITLELDSKISYLAVHECIADYLLQNQRQHNYKVDFMLNDIYADDTAKKRFTFRFTISHDERTLTTEETNLFIDHLSEVANAGLGAVRI